MKKILVMLTVLLPLTTMPFIAQAAHMGGLEGSSRTIDLDNTMSDAAYRRKLMRWKNTYRMALQLLFSLRMGHIH